jgi:hypothetical protein
MSQKTSFFFPSTYIEYTPLFARMFGLLCNTSMQLLSPARKNVVITVQGDSKFALITEYTNVHILMHLLFFQKNISEGNGLQNFLSNLGPSKYLLLLSLQKGEDIDHNII